VTVDEPKPARPPRKKTLANGKLRPAVRRGRAKRRAAKEAGKRADWLAQFKPGDRERFFNHVDLSRAVFLAGFARETGLDRFEAAALLERVGNERGWRKLRTLDRTVVGIAPPRARAGAIVDPDEGPTRHDILDLPRLGEDAYISIRRPADAPPLTAQEREWFEGLAEAALEHVNREPSE
jgi:hypothetical protein